MEPGSNDQQDELASLESSSTVVSPGPGADGVHIEGGPAPTPVQPLPSQRLVRWLRRHMNIYLVLFVIVLLGAGATGTVLYLRSSSNSVDILPQSLSQSTLDQLSNSDLSVGEPKHTLSVQSNAVFGGDVLVRQNLQIAGNLQVGSNLAIAGIRVTGNSTFDDVQITKSLAVTGNGSFQGQLNVQQGLSVNGNGTFLGALSASTITVSTLQLSGDLNLTRHLTAGGATPSRSNGGALGSGGTVSVSGSDTAGTVTINTGSSPSVGCFTTITFVTKFNTTPHLSLTPTNASAADLGYYASRSTTNFSVCTTTVPPAGTTLLFDYIVLD